MFHAQGIYYKNSFSPRRVTGTREVWVPSLDGDDWGTQSRVTLRARARTLAERSRRNESWNKSEYAWEADAWSCVFEDMRNDHTLEM